MADRGKPGEKFGCVAERFYSEVHRMTSVICRYNNGRHVDSNRNEVSRSPDPVSDRGHIRIRVIPGTPSRPELGPDAQTRYTGALMVMVFERLGSGESLTDEIVSRTLGFQQTIAEGIQYLTADLQEIGASPDGSWWQTNVTIPFRFSL